MMKNLPCFLLVCFSCISVAFSIDTSEIESLRLRVQDSSAELTGSEKGVISKFWSNALDQMLLSASSKEIVDVRKQLAEQKGGEHLSYYATSYISEALTSLQSAFENVPRLEDTQQRRMVGRNLMILTAELHSPQLTPLALQRFDAEDEVIRYWAVKAVTDPAIIQQLTSEVTRDEETVAAILEALKKRVSVEKQAEIQKMAIHFCMAFDHPTARDILSSIAGQRIGAYKSWTVTSGSLDARLLAVLGHVAVSQQDADIKKDFGRMFTELFALVTQRYQKGTDVLSEDQLLQAKMVIAEVDQNTLNKTMGIKTGILAAIKRGTGLKRECEILFGDRMRSGQLAAMFKFNYGTDASGKPVTAPPALGPFPEK